MSQSIDLTKFQPNEPSLCISYVFSNVRRQQVWDVMKEANLGFIERIDMVKMTGKDGKKFQRVFIHFKHWFRGPDSQCARTQFLNDEMLKLYYDDKWYWQLRASKSEKPAAAPLGKSRVRLERSDDKQPSDNRPTLGDFIPPKTSSPASPTSSMASSPGGTRRHPYPGSHDWSPTSSPRSPKSSRVPPPIKTDLEQPPLPARKRAPASS
tara:strand:- start:1066 stop:1692 length:627 start_codon:yes stop_codon:yes gene_type:complete